MIKAGDIRKQIERLASNRILILDGAMGALIQAFRTPSGELLTEDNFRGQGERFRNHRMPLKGCNDILCLTMPDLIYSIHEAYLEAGADIIETCSFNSTSISLVDYGLEDLSYEISTAAASLARKAADAFSTKDKPRFVAGSLGPTPKSASISPDLDNPGKRAVSWDDLEEAYYNNARGLLDGGADILIIETIFDTLNAKAAIFAARRLAEERCVDVPLIISATISEGGRLLSGQTVEAFCVSVLHADPLAIGLNCSFGAEKLKTHIGRISAAVPCLVIAYPNAGLPNRLGTYDESPISMANFLEEYLREGLINIVGGCCGSTPAHISVIAEKAANYVPRYVPMLPKRTLLSGLEVLEVNRERGLTEIGERTNVSGSRKFLKYIRDGDYDEAVEIARDMAETGAMLIDVCMDDPMLDAKAAMTNFLNFSLQFPDLARIPIMIDSSSWEVIEAGLKCLQGKGLVNSISLKEGEEEFIKRAGLAHSYGAAIVIMLFDEQGQAVSLKRRIEVAERSWTLLKKINFPPEDIVFDPNILAVATGIPEHDSYTLDFFKTCEWIRSNCPGAQISGGVSNLSFSFRGNNIIRKAMHAVFIKHAKEYGLSMAIVNPAALVSYDEIERELRDVIEDLILNRSPEINNSGEIPQSPMDRLLSLAETFSTSSIEAEGSAASGNGTFKNIEGTITLEPNYLGKDTIWRPLSAEERVTNAIIRGDESFLETDIEKLKTIIKDPLDIVEGSLMKGMVEVGDRFAEGRMFLPQVIRSARVMKKAITILEPYLGQEESGNGASGKSFTILIATVKGDVHDIGKNIAALVLGCNGYRIINLGVMVPADIILEKAKEEGADIIGLSGLITPSLDEMMHVAQEMEKKGFTIPLLIGGAAANLAHTALRIAPEYSGPVVYIPDASQAPGAVRSLLSEKDRPGFLEELNKTYKTAMERHDSIRKSRDLLSLEEARKNKVNPSWSIFAGITGIDSSRKSLFNLAEIFELPPEAESREKNLITLNNYPLTRVISHIDWTSFIQTWDLAFNTYPLAYNKTSRKNEKKILDKLLEDAEVLLENIMKHDILRLRGVVGFFPACSEGDDIILLKEAVRFCFPRNQERKANNIPNPCLADFILPRELYNQKFSESKFGDETNTMAPNPAGQLGLFALSAGFGLQEAEEEYRRQNDDYGALLLAGLANSLAEAFSDEVHCRLKKIWSITDSENYGIRPAFGYPACPDHKDKEIAFRVLEAKEHCGLQLTDTAMIIPAASVCGMYIAHPDSYYFGIGLMGNDQLRDWVRRKGITAEEARKRLGGVISG